METATIIVIAALAAIVIAAIVMYSRGAKDRKIDRAVEQRRDERIDEHRSEATAREREAERLEREAAAHRAEATAHAEHADLHERGLADDQLREEVVGKDDRAPINTRRFERDQATQTGQRV